MAALLLINTLFALLLASASIVYAFVWCLSYTFFFSSAGTAASLHSFTLAQLTKRMSLIRKNEEAAASLQESKEAAANLQESKEFERIEKNSKRMKE